MKNSFIGILSVLLIFASSCPSFGQDAEGTQTSTPKVESFLDGESIADDLKEINDLLDENSEALSSQSYLLDEVVFEVEEQAGTVEENQSAIKKFTKTSGDNEEALGKLTKSFNEFEASVNERLGRKANSGHSQSRLRVFGRIDIDALTFPESSPGIDFLEGGPAGPQDNFGFRRLRFGVAGDLPSNMDYRVELDFAGGNDPQILDAWIGFKDLPRLGNLRIGNQKRPYGLDHLNNSNHNVFLERPLIIQAFNQDSRRLGIQSLRTSADESWNIRSGIFNLRSIQDDGNTTNDQWQPEVASRLANTYWYDEGSGGRGYGHWAISGTWAFPDGSTPFDNGATGPDANAAQFQTTPEALSASSWLDTGPITGADDYRLIGLEKVFNYGPFQLTGEFQAIQLDRDAGSDLNFHGGYVYASYFLTGEHIPWSRSTGTLGRVKPFENFFLVRGDDCSTKAGLGAWQIAARYSWADLNSVDILGGTGESLTLGVNWHWSPYARMQFNWVHGTIEDSSAIGIGGDYDILNARFSVDF